MSRISTQEGLRLPRQNQSLGCRFWIQFIHFFNCPSIIYFPNIKEAHCAPGIVLSTGETEKRLFPQLWRKKTFQVGVSSCLPVGEDNTVIVTLESHKLGK